MNREAKTLTHVTVLNIMKARRPLPSPKTQKGGQGDEKRKTTDFTVSAFGSYAVNDGLLRNQRPADV